jgi:hypothetical protein
MDKEKILEAISQEDIMQHYFPYEIEEGKSYLNPFRKEEDADKNPGCKFYYSGDTLIFKDFTHPDLSGDCFKICSLSTKTNNFQDTLKTICRDFNLNWKMNSFSDIKEFGKRRTKVIKKKQVEDQNKVVETKLVFTTSDLDMWDYTYWETNYKLDEKDLEKWNVLSLDSVVITKKRANDTTTTFRRTFNKMAEQAYCFDHGPYGKTGYVPNYAKEERSEFYKSVPFSYVMGVENLRKKHGKPDYVIVTKSYKDLMVLDKLNIPVVSLQNETPRITEGMKKEIESLCKFSPIIIYDNDEAGKRMVRKLSESTSWPFLELDEYIDPAEYVQFDAEKQLRFFIVSSVMNKSYKKEMSE